MLSTYHFNRIRDLAAQGKSNSEIVRDLKIDRKTVGKYRRSNTPPRYTSRNRRAGQADPFEKFAEVARGYL